MTLSPVRIPFASNHNRRQIHSAISSSFSSTDDESSSISQSSSSFQENSFNKLWKRNKLVTKDSSCDHDNNKTHASCSEKDNTTTSLTITTSTSTSSLTTRSSASRPETGITSAASGTMNRSSSVVYDIFRVKSFDSEFIIHHQPINLDRELDDQWTLKHANPITEEEEEEIDDDDDDDGENENEITLQSLSRDGERHDVDAFSIYHYDGPECEHDDEIESRNGRVMRMHSVISRFHERRLNDNPSEDDAIVRSNRLDTIPLHWDNCVNDTALGSISSGTNVVVPTSATNASAQIYNFSSHVNNILRFR